MLNLDMSNQKIKKIFISTMVFVIAASLLTVGYAATPLFQLENNLTVPEPTTEIQLFQEDGTTPVTNLQNITSLWIWDEANAKFQLLLKAKNVASQTVTLDVRTDNIPNWSLTVNGEGAVPAGATQTLNITMKPSSTVAGFTTGTFNLYIDKV